MEQGPEPGLYERAVLTLVARGGADLDVLSLSPHGALLGHKGRLGRKTLVAVLRAVPSSPEALDARLKKLAELSRRERIDLLLVGGRAESWEALRRHRPFYRRRLGIAHLDERGALQQASCAVLGKLFDSEAAARCLQPLPDEEPDWRTLLARGASLAAELEAEQREYGIWVDVIRSRRPWATIGLLALNALIFLVVLALGRGAILAPVLGRAGALIPARVVEQGEWWRLLSCTFLHAGWIHLLMNGYVLYLLGSFLERIVGPSRFLCLYVLAAIGGSLGSSLFLGEIMSVGASGAIWGLLGAHAVLAYRDRGLLPRALVPGARAAARTNTVINIAISFLPFVDMWAHFAGGATGALVMLSGVLTRGLAPLGRREGGKIDAERAAIPTSLGLRGAAVLLLALLLTGPLLAFLPGAALWQLHAAPARVPYRLEALGLEVDALPGLRVREDGEARGLVILGSEQYDPLVAYIAHAPALPSEEFPVEARLERFATAPELELEEVGAPMRFSGPGYHGVQRTFQSGDMFEDRVRLARGGALLDVTVVRFDGLGFHDEARRVAASARPLR